MLTRTLIAALAVLIFAYSCFLPVAHAEHHGAQKAVLVTGATSGIGLRIAEELAENGYFVYAGARKQADIDRLNKIENVEAVRLDVTVQDDIDAAVARIRDAGRGLYGLVNNAGVYIGGPVTDVDIE
ncbi:MAG: SDR family NAD(P)-dependent oxidoreductase, partial [Woeseiaceae bacterium]